MIYLTPFFSRKRAKGGGGDFLELALLAKKIYHGFNLYSSGSKYT